MCHNRNRYDTNASDEVVDAAGSRISKKAKVRLWSVKKRLIARGISLQVP